MESANRRIGNRAGLAVWTMTETVDAATEPELAAADRSGDDSLPDQLTVNAQQMATAPGDTRAISRGTETEPMVYTAVCYILHDDAYYLAESIASFKGAGDVLAFVSRVPWHDRPGDWESAAGVARDAGAEVIAGDWTSELAQREAAFLELFKRGYTHAFIPDGDEIVEPGLLQSLLRVAEHALADRVSVYMDTYWKSPEYVIRPREPLAPVLLVDIRNAYPIGLRNFAGGRPLVLPPEHGVLHHLSYVGPDERIRRKLATWGHHAEVLPGWYEQVWLGWDGNKLMRNLHPTHPPAYGFTERIHVPDLLQPAMARCAELYPQISQMTQITENGPQTFNGPQAIVSPPSPAERSDGNSGRGGQGVRAWPKVSVVIPLYGGREDLRLCLDSLELCSDLLHEVIVVDNASPDDAAQEVEERSQGLGVGGQEDQVMSPSTPQPTSAKSVKSVDKVPFSLLRNETNEGFAAACNRGLEASSGEVALFLNSDTVVPRRGLVRLIEALMRSGTVAAAGPFTNCCGHGQQIAVNYTALDTLDLFAEDFAERTVEDVETDMLVGFCLAVRRSVLDEIGGFDTRFGLGTFEDNDLCYRMRRAGYRLVIAARSFVHHSGSKTFRRMEEGSSPQITQITQIEDRDGKASGDTAMRETGSANVAAGQHPIPNTQHPPFDLAQTLRVNEAIYREKWRGDRESGFASTLSGLSAERIVFDAERRPDRRMRRILHDALRADISLCMIVRDEERVLRSCLESAKPFFREMIVVDTGSADRTKEIAREMGTRVFDFPWTDSFSEARNESLRHAKGRWIFWMDADDTLPVASGEALLHAALTAPAGVVGFVVPVQFVEEGEGAGTRVDHVKLFRNRPGLAFEGHIHEQILSSLRKGGGEIARCGAVVLHSGYDTSPEGQAKKRVRDSHLLKLDLAERPDHPFVLFNLGMTDHYGGEPESAIRWLKRCIEVSAPTDSQVRKAYALLALSQRQAGDGDGCIATLEQGLKVIPNDPELHFHLAHTVAERGEFRRAKLHYQQTLECPRDDHFSSVDIGILGYKTFHNLGSVCLALDEYQSARKWWKRAIEAAPRFLPSVFALFDASVEAGDLATAKQMLEAVYRAEGAGENWLRMGIKHVEALTGPEGAVSFLRRALASHPRSAAVGMAWTRHLLQSGQEQEARAHLHPLAQAGVAEAAYCLGVFAIRAGKLEEALAWMKRAAALNPDHADTQAQIASLKAALETPPVTPSPSHPLTPSSMTLEQAVTQVASDLGLDREALWGYTQEDNVGGYREQGAEAETPAWPGGSVWEEEGRLLYGLVRALKPERIVEIGSLVGCSTSHLALACQRNGMGKVYAVDPALEFSRVDAALLEYVLPIPEDVFVWELPDGPVSLVFEDGAHTPGFTRAALEKLRPALAPGAVVVSHDYLHARLGRHVSQEFDEVLAGCPNAVVGSARIAPSDCGLGYARLACGVD